MSLPGGKEVVLVNFYNTILVISFRKRSITVSGPVSHSKYLLNDVS